MISRPITIVELDMDKCIRTYGVAPCTGSKAASLSCYNTRATCQSPANYSSTAQTYRFSDTAIGVPPSVEAIPCVESVSIAPTRLTPLKGLGQRASVTVTLSDFAHHDRGFDPYVASRTYTPEDQGTFFGRFRARHTYYQGRPLRVRMGSIADPWDWNLFDDRTYIIERIEGPDKSGRIKITAKDLLKLADNDRATCPLASTSTLSANITSGSGSLTLLPSGIGASEWAGREQTAGAGYCRIGSEIMTYTRSSDVLTLTARGAWGTAAAAHTAGDGVQLCASWSATNVADVMKDMLLEYAGVDAAYINTTDWNAEKTGNLSAYTLTGIISKPEGVAKLLGELTEQCLALLWWDELNQLIKLKAVAPYTTDTPISDDSNLILGSVQVQDDPAQRISQVWTYWGIIDPTATDKAENYRCVHVQADLTAEAAAQYGEQRIKEIRSRWFTSLGPVAQAAGRTLIWMRDNPRIAKFLLDTKDRALDIGDNLDFLSDAIQGADGAAASTELFVIERADKGGHVEYTAMSAPFFGRYGRVAPNGTPVYTSASDAEKDAYGFIATDSSGFADGGLVYKIA